MKRDSFAGLWRPVGSWASRALGAWGVALSLFHCPVVFASVAPYLSGMGLGARGGDVRLAWVPGFGVECLGSRFFAFFAFFHLGLVLFSTGGSL